MTIKAQSDAAVMIPRPIYEITVELAHQAGAPEMRAVIDDTTRLVYAIGYLAGLAKAVKCAGG